MEASTGSIDLDGLSRLGAALSDHTRRRLLVALARGPGYPAELAVELDESRQNISNHLACLRGCGLVVASPEGRRMRYVPRRTPAGRLPSVVASPEGRRMRYELVDARLATALRDLVELTVAADPQHAHQPEHRA